LPVEPGSWESVIWLCISAIWLSIPIRGWVARARWCPAWHLR